MKRLEGEPAKTKQEATQPMKGNGITIPGGIPVNTDINEVGYRIRLKTGGPAKALRPEQIDWAKRNPPRGSE